MSMRRSLGWANRDRGADEGHPARVAPVTVEHHRSTVRGLVPVVANVALVAMLGAACSAPTAPAATPSVSGQPSPTPAAAATTIGTEVVGGDRPVVVRVPTSYDPNRPAPLLLQLHGYTSRGSEVDGYFGFAAVAEEPGVVIATPEGTTNAQGDRFWNATDACCNFDRSTVDDVAYLAEVIAEIQAELSIDPERIAVVGHSNGGFMAHRMACERADLVTSIVSLAGATFADPADCRPSEPVSVVQVHGTADDVIRFDGAGPLSPGTGPYPGAVTTAETWAANDGCGPTPSVLPEPLDLDAGLEVASKEAETTVSEWSGCDAGSTVQLWTIEGGGHVPALTPAFADAVIRFVAEHPRP
jgi:polyhydroxybutyrate depolymerase